jgi:ATPase subunit of ABC transporter with duplicated ATPase domains
MKLNKFKVEKLHGLFDYELEFKDNTLILIGENGSCKTTLMKVLFYFLTQQWTKLAIYDFSSVAVTVDNETISLNKTDIDIDRGSEYPYLRRLPSRIYHEIMLMRDTGVDMDRLEMIGDRYGIPVSYLMNAALPNEKAKNKKHFLKVKEWLLKRMQDVYFIYFTESL